MRGLTEFGKAEVDEEGKAEKHGAERQRQLKIALPRF
jgi:hypothetical protein